MLRRFQSLRLIKLIGEDADPEAPVVLYPSLAFAIDGGTIDNLESRLDELTGTGDAEDSETRETALEGIDDIEEVDLDEASLGELESQGEGS